MRATTQKIAFLISFGLLIVACSTNKNVPEDKLLLVKNKITVNEKTNIDEILINQLSQKPNNSFLGFPLRLQLYNIAKLNADSTFEAKYINNKLRYERLSKLLSQKQVHRLGQSFLFHGVNEFLKKVGEAPIIVDSSKAAKSVQRLKSYYFNNGYFNVDANYKIDSLKNRKAKIDYKITTNEPYLIDSITRNISSKKLDSLYHTQEKFTLIKKENQFRSSDFEEEKNRITTHFRNNGVYYFQPTYVNYNIDTINKKNKANVELKIKDYSFLENDTTKVSSFKMYKISDVTVYTNYSATKNIKYTDTLNYNNFRIISDSKLKYKPKALTNGVFISKGSLYSDENTNLTIRYLNNLKNFSYPTIQYEANTKDSTSNSLNAKIYLSPRKKYSFGTSFDVTHSNIQSIGIQFSPSLSVRNIFKGAEILEIAARSSLGSSQDLANPDDKFFNVSEFGLDFKLNFPRIFFPFATERLIPKSMIPSTQISLGYSNQQNIGLDKENLTGAFTYNWTPKKNHTSKFELLNIQFVHNLNPSNYFNVYNSSYDALNAIASTYNTTASNVGSDGNLIISDGTTNFTTEVLGGNTSLTATDTDYQTVKSIEERRDRLTQNDFILSSSYSFSKTTKENLQDNTFYIFKSKIESAGSVLSLIANAAGLPKNASREHELFNLPYSEYIKTEFEYIKHWDLTKDKVLAFRSFFGIAIPFGNSNDVPFSRSYFAGGSNDNRAWQAYSLGPGSSGATNDFNEANMKIAFNSEFRFKMIGAIKGAVFVDIGNIWNVLDKETDSDYIFENLSSFKDLAIGTGYGIRYDLKYFVIRLDLGFKTFNPALDTGEKWFKEINFSKSVLNFGINYPF